VKKRKPLLLLFPQAKLSHFATLLDFTELCLEIKILDVGGDLALDLDLDSGYLDGGFLDSGFRRSGYSLLDLSHLIVGIAADGCVVVVVGCVGHVCSVVAGGIEAFAFGPFDIGGVRAVLAVILTIFGLAVDKRFPESP